VPFWGFLPEPLKRPAGDIFRLPSGVCRPRAYQWENKKTPWPIPWWIRLRGFDSPIVRGLAFHDRGDTHAAGGADGDQDPALTLVLEQFGGTGQHPRAGRSEGMTQGDAAALHV